MAVELRDFSWQRMIEAVQAVRERALRATAALERAGIPYAVAGGNAVAAWVSRVDRAAVRNTQDVDILVRRSDFEAVKAALESVGFVHATVMDVTCFIDGPDGNPRDAVHLLFAGEKVRESFRDKDRMHLRDLIDLGLIDASWLPKCFPEHAARLQQLLDDPDG